MDGGGDLVHEPGFNVVLAWIELAVGATRIMADHRASADGIIPLSSASSRNPRVLTTATGIGSFSPATIRGTRGSSKTTKDAVS